LTNQVRYAIKQQLMDVNTILICNIDKVNDDGSCDVSSLINMIDNLGNPIEPPLQFNLPIMQIRGGIAGIEIPPVKDDKVVVGFAQRNISTIKKQLTRQNPANLRQFDVQDGIVLGVLSNTPPTIKIKFSKDGIDIISADKDINITGQNINATIANKATITANECDIISNNINLGGSGGAYVLTKNTIINDSEGKPCEVISQYSTTTKAL
jgi:hypothetical protein